MDIKIEKSILKGGVLPPFSKSYTIRTMLCSFLAGDFSTAGNEDFLFCDDTKAMGDIINKLYFPCKKMYSPNDSGNKEKNSNRKADICPAFEEENVVIAKYKSENNISQRTVIDTDKDQNAIENCSDNSTENFTQLPVLDCRGSAAVMRFVLPMLGALGISAELRGNSRLSERPIAELIDVLSKKGMTIKSRASKLPLFVSGKLSPGVYELCGNVSSQYISALLMALPLLDSGSEIRLTTELESAQYVDMTLSVMNLFGVEAQKTEKGWSVRGRQKYHVPPCAEKFQRCAAKNAEADCLPERDWSAAAFWETANFLGADIEISNMNDGSLQPDSKICSLLSFIGSSINLKNAPDLAPALAVCALARNCKTKLCGLSRLKLKESNRLISIEELIKSLGGSCNTEDDTLIITGSGHLNGGIADSFDDHRIAMAAAVASIICDSPVIIKNAECISKSYPAFFDDMKSLGGKVYEI